MTITKFPPHEDADESGILALGGDLEVPSLLLAYKNGIFPWPISIEHPLAWFSPDPRGVLMIKDLHISKSFQKFLKSSNWKIKFNHSFHQVIQRCAFADNRKDQTGTWITPQVIKSYIDFYNAGYAFSVETYQDNNLIGGLYGIKVGRYVAGESMFYLQSHASKFALYHLMKKLEQENIEWLDTQMVTPLTSSFGAVEIERDRFLNMHKEVINQETFTFS